MSQIFDKTISGLGTALNMRLLKQNVIASNIANAETPGYHAKKIDFEEALARAMDIDGLRSMNTSHGDHFHVGGKGSSSVRPDIYDNPDGVINNDGNTVDLHHEMAAQAENNVMYRAALQLINKKLAALRYAATDGR
ncbi:MAG: flagellar basal body rod protein FlgB [Oligoflexia bacterium]|nr:MAG: flagellar basal body rod protein FlgB [Oligoflexia bacterium]